MTPPGTPGTAPAQAAPGTDNVPGASDSAVPAVAAVADLPMPVDAPTLAGILADSPAAVPPSPTPTVILQPPVISSATPARASVSGGGRTSAHNDASGGHTHGHTHTHTHGRVTRSLAHWYRCTF